DEDYEQIEKGVTSPEEIIQNRLLMDLEYLEDECKKNHARVLGWLISNNQMEIKIGYIEEKFSGKEIFHQKIGILKDTDGNIVTFVGSNNESAYGWIYNSEKFKAFLSWENNYIDAIREDIEEFEELWYNRAKKTRVVPFPDAVKQNLIHKFQKSRYNLDELLSEVDSVHEGNSGTEYQSKKPSQ